MYKEAQRILERQRFQFPSNWLYIDNVEGEWGAFTDIMKRKDSSIQTQVASLQMKISSEDTLVENKTATMLQEWEKEKPVAVRFDCCTLSFVPLVLAGSSCHQCLLIELQQWHLQRETSHFENHTF